MFERFRRHRDTADDTHAERGNGVAVREHDRTVVRPPDDDDGERRAARNGDPVAAMPPRTGTGVATAERTETERRPVAERAATEAELRRREEFGGLNWGAAFFGWLVAIGLAALLVGIVAAAGTAIGLVEVSGSEVQGNAEAIGIVGGALLVGILALAYFAGGYVAGRMSRFDGARQGAGVWVIGLLTTIVLAIAGIVGGTEYNVLERLDLPRIPIDEGDLTTGGAIALGAVLLGTLLASMLGGKAGQRYHRRVDTAGWDVR
jgi:hypothetical protein